ncbi:MAG: hypothetical protein Q4G16_06215 [Cruoricaptor ignavus]|nr:hypothetical protein [Cruoricaptor ignavus]
MYKKLIVLSIFFILFSCKKKEINCHEKFQDLYLKRWTLWFGSEKTSGISYTNFTEKEYQLLKKQINDSLQITIDCALKK